jgi:hypothetical protein
MGAFVCGIIGGAAILLVSAFEIALGAWCATTSCNFVFGGVPDVYIASGILGVVVGAMVIVFATLAYLRPEHHVAAGIMLIVFSILSLVSFGGGLGIGFVLTLVAGILAIAWQSGPQYLGYQPVFPAPYPYSFPSPYSAPAPVPPTAPVAAAPAVQRICLKCGRAVDLQANFCSHCGNTLG